MKGLDARSLSHNTLEYIRFRAVRAIQKGFSVREVANIFGIHRSRIYEWLKLVRKRGMNALKERPVPGRKPKLNDTQNKVLELWLCIFTPRDFGFESNLWTLKIIRKLIEIKFFVKLSISAVGRLLHRLHMSPQRPTYHAVEQDPAAVERWVKEEFPKIKELAEKEGAIIYFVDESSVRNDHHAGTTWSDKGLTPIVNNSGKHCRANMIGGITPEGKSDFQVGPQSLDAEVFVEYLKKLSEDASRPIFIVTDNHPVHHSKVVKKYIEETKGVVRIFFIPAYSPKLNPIELVWNEIKSHELARQVISSTEDLATKLSDLLGELKSIPDKVRSFFKEDNVNYILA